MDQNSVTLVKLFHINGHYFNIEFTIIDKIEINNWKKKQKNSENVPFEFDMKFNPLTRK